MGGEKESNIFSKFALSLTVSILMLQLIVPSSIISSNSNADPNTRGPAKWTVMIYMAGDNDLSNAAVDDLNEMEVAGSNSEVNIVVLLDGNDDGDTKLYYVNKDPNGYHGSIVSEELSADWLKSELNMGDPMVFVNFTNWVLSNYPAEHYYLNFWSHGNGWQATEDWSQNDDLMTYELKYAFSQIKEANGGLKFDIVGFDVCRMGSLEINYQIVDYAKIVIASEKDVERDGLPYERILGALVSNSSISPVNLSKMVVHEYVESYRIGSVPSGGYAVTLSAIDLNTLNTIFDKAFKDFPKGLSVSIPYFRSQIDALRSSTEKYEGGQFFDLYHFAQLCADSDDISQEIRLVSRDLIDTVKETVIAEDHWNPSNPKKGYANNAHGISIYFDDIDLHQDYRDFVISDRTPWDEFLDRYYSYETKPSVALESSIAVFDGDGITGNESIMLSFMTNKTALNLTVEVYDSGNEHIATLYNQSTSAGVNGNFSFHLYDFGGTSDYYTFFLSLKNSSGILQNYVELDDIWLGNERPDVLVTNMTFFRQDGAVVGGNSGKHPVEKETTTLTATIVNNGDENLTNLHIGLFDGDDILIQKCIHLNISEEKFYKFHWIGSIGWHQVRLFADYDNSIKETDEANNEISERIEVKSIYPENSFVIEAYVTTGENQIISGAKVFVTNQRTRQIMNTTVENSFFTLFIPIEWYMNGDNLTVKVVYEKMEKEGTFCAYSEDIEKNIIFKFDPDEGGEEDSHFLTIVFVILTGICIVLMLCFLRIRKKKAHTIMKEKRGAYSKMNENEQKEDNGKIHKK